MSAPATTELRMHYAGRLVVPHRDPFVRADVTCRRCLSLIERADRHRQASGEEPGR